MRPPRPHGRVPGGGSNALCTSLGGSTSGTANQVLNSGGGNQQAFGWLGLRIVVPTTGYPSFYTNAYDGLGWVLRGTAADHPIPGASTLYPYMVNYLNNTGTTIP